jgi:D-mannonate dehydratase
VGGVKVLLREQDLSEEFVRFAAQIGADGFDFHDPNNLPGVGERGYADATGLRGLLYCVGTRYETGVNIYDDIRAMGRRGKIFHVHFRNVRGTIPATGGYEEVALHDGDMNMFRVLKALRETGYDGGLQVDHIPGYDGDSAFSGIGWGYAVGYVKALLAALEAA